MLAEEKASLCSLSAGGRFQDLTRAPGPWGQFHGPHEAQSSPQGSPALPGHVRLCTGTHMPVPTCVYKPRSCVFRPAAFRPCSSLRVSCVSSCVRMSGVGLHLYVCWPCQQPHRTQPFPPTLAGELPDLPLPSLGPALPYPS